EMNKSTANAVIDVLETYDINGFVYTLHSNSLVTYYESLGRKAMRDFHDERVNVYEKRFEQVKRLSESINEGKILYFTILDEYEKLIGAYETLKKISEVNVAFYRDVYAEGMWFLEVYSNKASKSSAVQHLRKEYGFTHITGFGDNFNDIPLLSACDEFYAVLNAVDELKKRATGLIYDNNSDGVARFLYKKSCT
ncbi:MAG TPA: HAD hydrolase family protein, partial [Clostridia bacterium]